MRSRRKECGRVVRLLAAVMVAWLAALPAAASDAPRQKEIGRASWYGGPQDGQKTASGEPYDQDDLTAAHPSLPMNARVRVTNLRNGRSVVVRINDRGPHARGRVIDVSRRAAEILGMRRHGVATVKVETLAD
jgi:rare lipoprotein A